MKKKIMWNIYETFYVAAKEWKDLQDESDVNTKKSERNESLIFQAITSPGTMLEKASLELLND